MKTGTLEIQKCGDKAETQKAENQKTENQKTGNKILENCSLCPRNCKADRLAGRTGYCGMDGKLRVARAALHMWEEPCISGSRGSGAVFFTGCNLRCCFCQNRDIAIGDSGLEISVERLSEIFLELQGKGAANINLVTGTHYIPQIITALDLARKHFVQSQLFLQNRINTDIAFITYVGCTVEQQNNLKKQVEQCVPFDRLILQRCSVPIVSNAGLGIIAITYIRKDMKEIPGKTEFSDL